MKNTIRLVAALGVLIACCHFVGTAIWLNSGLYERTFLLSLAAIQLAACWLIIDGKEKSVELSKLKKSLKATGFYPARFHFRDIHHKDESGAIHAVLTARAPDETPFTMEIIRTAMLAPVFASVSLHTTSEDHWYDFTIHPTMDEARTARRDKMRSEAA